MSHCIQAIVAPLATAERISEWWRELPRLDRQDGFSVFPVSAELIDARISPDGTLRESGDEFKLLTGGLQMLLESLSRGGELAYIETEYWGGRGGQGALVCRDGRVLMPPTWSESGTINEALNLIGLRRGSFEDSFAAIGFAEIRDNGDFLALIAAQAPKGGDC